MILDDEAYCWRKIRDRSELRNLFSLPCGPSPHIIQTWIHTHKATWSLDLGFSTLGTGELVPGSMCFPCSARCSLTASRDTLGNVSAAPGLHVPLRRPWKFMHQINMELRGRGRNRSWSHSIAQTQGGAHRLLCAMLLRPRIAGSNTIYCMALCMAST